MLVESGGQQKIDCRFAYLGMGFSSQFFEVVGVVALWFGPRSNTISRQELDDVVFAAQSARLNSRTERKQRAVISQASRMVCIWQPADCDCDCDVWRQRGLKVLSRLLFVWFRSRKVAADGGWLAIRLSFNDTPLDFLQRRKMVQASN